MLNVNRTQLTRLSENKSFPLFLLLVFAAYPFVAVATFVVDLGSTNFSIALRALIFLLALALIIVAKPPRRPAVAALIFTGILIYWACYLTRMSFDTFIFSKYLFKEHSIYWMWAIGSCFVPLLAFALQDQDRINFTKSFHVLYWSFVMVSLLIGIFASQVVDTLAYGRIDSGRTELPALNPISLGHVGTTLFALVVYKFNNMTTSMTDRFLRCGPVLVLSGYLIIASNSRGPLFAAVAILLFLIWASKGRHKVKTLLLALSALAVFVPATQFLEENYKISTFSRLFKQNFFEEENVAGRAERYVGAMSDFAQSPIFGSGLEPSDGSAYPHNLIVESFLSMGIVIGVLFVVLLATLFVQAKKLYLTDTNKGWVSLLFVQHAVGSQFSGAIYDSGYFWSSVGILISAIGLQKQAVMRPRFRAGQLMEQSSPVDNRMAYKK